MGIVLSILSGLVVVYTVLCLISIFMTWIPGAKFTKFETVSLNMYFIPDKLNILLIFTSSVEYSRVVELILYSVVLISNRLKIPLMIMVIPVKIKNAITG